MTDAICVTGDDIETLVEQTTISEYIEVVEAGYRQRGEGAPAKPRTRLNPTDGPWGMLTSYMAILPETGAMGGYMYDVGFESKDAWLTASLWDSSSGEFLAHLDGNAWNSQKTGAVGAVSIDVLARESASTMGVIGSGLQAQGQVSAAADVRDLGEVKVFSPSRESRKSFADKMDEKLDAEVVPVESSREAVAHSDIVVTATTAAEPVFESDSLSPGTHITAMGQYHPDRRELDMDTISRAKYVPDLTERAFQDAGSFLHALRNDRISEDHIHAELGDIVAGNTVGRESEDEITIFDSGGTGIETVAAANMLYELAVEQDVGLPISAKSAREIAEAN